MLCRRPCTGILFARVSVDASITSTAPGSRAMATNVEDIAVIAICRLLRYGLFVLAFAPLSAFASSARVYVTNSAGDSIHVVDTTTNKVVQVIKGIEAAHGINFAPDGSKVYVSNESTSTHDVFDREAAT